MMNADQYNVSPDKFKLVQADAVIKDVKFDTKPVGFFKDALNRFRKNKSSVVAAFIILFLLLFAIFGPIFSHYKTSDIDGYYSKVLPKSQAFSWLGWDGTKKFVNQTELAYDKFNGIGVEKNSSANNASYAPIKKLYKVTDSEQYVGKDLLNITFYDYKLDTYLAVGFQYVDFHNVEYVLLQAYQNQSNTQVLFPIPQFYGATQDGNVWYRTIDEEYTELIKAHQLKQMVSKNYGTAVWKDGVEGQYIPDYIGSSNKNHVQYYSKLRIDGDDGTYTYNKFKIKNSMPEIVNGVVQTTPLENQWYVYAQKKQSGYFGRVLYHEYAKYLRTKYTFKDGMTYEDFEAAADALVANKSATEEDWNNLFSKVEFNLKSGFYPEFIFGTNGSGKDIFTLLGSGARLSFILAISISIINLTIGAFYGAVEGYFGGTVDIIMERISDILSGVPFIVVATLFKLHLADKVGPLVSLLFAFVLTGWIGMASRVRMQFYRFKGQEYILSARTLGAKDFRIMFKHIFPNAIGTIITGSILTIPGVIFSESMLSYLGIIDLEASNYTSIGTLLSDGSTSIKDYPHILFFPALFISLLMISFNLFGNGLRDAFNPSLRGADE